MRLILILAVLSFFVAIYPGTPAWLCLVLAFFAAMMVGFLTRWLVRGK